MEWSWQSIYLYIYLQKCYSRVSSSFRKCSPECVLPRSLKDYVLCLSGKAFLGLWQSLGRKRYCNLKQNYKTGQRICQSQYSWKEEACMNHQHDSDNSVSKMWLLSVFVPILKTVGLGAMKGGRPKGSLRFFQDDPSKTTNTRKNK